LLKNDYWNAPYGCVPIAEPQRMDRRCVCVCVCVFIPVLQLLVMTTRSAWHTVSLRSARSLMVMPSARARPLKEASRSTAPVQNPGSMVQIWGTGGREEGGEGGEGRADGLNTSFNTSVLIKMIL